MPMPKTVCRTIVYNKIAQLEVCRASSGRGMGTKHHRLVAEAEHDGEEALAEGAERGPRRLGHEGHVLRGRKDNISMIRMI